MNRLEYCFDCLDGRYVFTAVNEDGIIRYTIESTIAGLESKEGELSESTGKAFIEAVDSAKIESWDRVYGPESAGIEDAVKWKTVLIRDDKEYVTKGEESYEPYGYEHLIAALKLCEEKADYFRAEAHDE